MFVAFFFRFNSDPPPEIPRYSPNQNPIHPAGVDRAFTWCCHWPLGRRLVLLVTIRLGLGRRVNVHRMNCGCDPGVPDAVEFQGTSKINDGLVGDKRIKWGVYLSKTIVNLNSICNLHVTGRGSSSQGWASRTLRSNGGL